MPGRRKLLLGLLAAPLAVAGTKGVGGLAAVATLARPRAAGTSGGRCARCGDPGHTMLGACPADPQVLA